MGETVIRESKLILKGSPLGGENPQPFFCQPDLAVAAGHNFPDGKKYSFGRETGFRVLPYTMQDRYKRELVVMEFTSIVLENSFLKAEIVPALGGRLWSLFDKQQNRNILYKNSLFRPANLAIRDAWFSGGIEWNIGRLGHTVHTCSPVFAGVYEDSALPILRLWEFERQTKLFWSIDFFLPKDSPVLYSYTRIENPDPQAKPLYWWTNIAVLQTKNVRVFSNTDKVIYIVPDTGKVKTMDWGCLPELPVLPGKDATYPALSDYSNEYFFQNDCPLNSIAHNMPWEAVVYEDGYGFGEMSTPALLYRKMFTWGVGRGGKRWQEFLSSGKDEYLEIQAGLAPTQLHTADIGGNETLDWVQVFTAFNAEPVKAHQQDYNAAAAHAADCLTKLIDPNTLQKTLEQCRQRAALQTKILNMGSGWGALETKLRGYCPPGLSFPDSSIGKAEAPWAELVTNGKLPNRPPEAAPGAFAAGEAWEKLLLASSDLADNWLTHYHLGVIYYEKGDTEKAVIEWEKSVKRKENPWALRNLALAAKNSGNIETALDYFRKARGLGGYEDQSFAEEFIPMLLTAGKNAEAKAELDVYMQKMPSLDALSTPLLEAAARIALNQGDDVTLDKIFSIEQPHIREGNNAMVDIWFEREKRRGKPAERAGSLPPREIDFRMFAR